MPSLIDLRRRIRSVKNTQQITKAMKVVSAAKLRRAQDRVLAARPYAQIIRRMLGNVALAAAEQSSGEEIDLLARRPERRILLLVITADRGLAGAFNSNVIRLAQKFIAEHRESEVHLDLIGRKGREFFKRRHANIAAEYTTLFQKAPRYEDALEIARKVIELYQKAEVDAVYLLVNNFKSMMASRLVSARLLPIELPEKKEQIDYIYEQPPAELLAALMPRYIESQVYRAMLESDAAQHAARMTAMEAASSNASDVISSLTLTMNRVRQASITREIIEIVSGAAALD
ncbi:MAG TPA: ATP synthase F1 subunit gamma [Bryobacteraceae bacterium]|nr:ATP synthase F1 subunit gamma [Bryobacteraceae bacterium]